MTYSIIDCPDGRFAVLAFSASGSVYRRGALLTLTDAESCVEELRALMALCGASIVRRRDEVLGVSRCGAIGMPGWRGGNIS